MVKFTFEWDQRKAAENLQKHGVSFTLAQQAFFDAKRVVARDLKHSKGEQRYYCMGRVEDAVLTGRFTLRGRVIRIIGTGYWRKGRKVYEEQNQIHE
jgi:uncharacterized DUF497 family protein